MKKIIKSISMICLAFLLICPVFLTGCAKNLTLNFTVEGVGGSFYKFSDATAEMTGDSISGDTIIKEGSDFEYRVKPDTGYKIKELVIDGNEVVLSESEKLNGTVKVFENITENHSVKVFFELRQWAVTFVCLGGSEPELFTLENVTHNTSINVGTNEFGGADNDYWYVIVNSAKIYLVNGQDDLAKELAADWQENQVTINSDRTIYTDLTLAELEANIEALNA